MNERQIDEPCLNCGDETAAGSVRYSGRHDIKLQDGRRKYLCDECYAKARGAKGGELTEADLQVIGENGVMVAAGFFPGGGGF